MQKRWHIKTVDSTVVEQLHTDLNIKKSLCKILAVRGINDGNSAKHFFRPQMADLHDPFLIKDMQIAVDRILQAIQAQEKILIYGDYDVDGTTAVSVLYSFLKKYTQQLSFYIPNRFKEGYGVSLAGIEYAKQNAYSLLITLDCGIRSTELIQQAKDSGIDTIICDHHLPDSVLPNAIAILNPKQPLCNYPYKELCGCGISYKLICALENTIEGEINRANDYIDLVATAIAADIVPMTGENRILTFYGLLKANTKPSYGIQALKIVSEFDNSFKVNDLVFIVAPRVNAAGRMDDASKAVKMFIADTLEEAQFIAKEININNTDRKEIDTTTTEEALTLLEHESQDVKSTVLYQPHWHKGIVGIVASRMIDHRYRPTIILTESNGKLTGSARSIPGLNLFDALSECSHLLETFGGHYFAAGLTLLEENLQPFKEKFNAVVQNTLTDNDFIPQLFIDTEIEFGEITQKYYNIIEQMEPFGPDNLRPVFITKNVTDHKGYSCIVKDKHLKYVLEHNNTVIKGIGFNQAHFIDIIKQGKFDIVYTLDKNVWNNTISIEIKVLDIKPAQ